MAIERLDKGILPPERHADARVAPDAIAGRIAPQPSDIAAPARLTDVDALAPASVTPATRLQTSAPVAAVSATKPLTWIDTAVPFDPSNPGTIAGPPINGALDAELAKRQPLKGQKVAIAMESGFVPQEIATYDHRIRAYGGEPVYVTNLFGNKELTFDSVADHDDVPQSRTIKVNTDFSQIDLKSGKFAAVIMPVHVQERLMYFDPTAKAAGNDAVADARQLTPAVQLMQQALKDPRIVAGGFGHGVNIFQSLGQELQGAKFTSTPASAVGLQNAGGRYDLPTDKTKWGQQVVVSRDNGVNLVTGTELLGGGLEAYVDAVARTAGDIKEERESRKRMLLGQLANASSPVLRRKRIEDLKNDNLLDATQLAALGRQLEDPAKLKLLIDSLSPKAAAEWAATHPKEGYKQPESPTYAAEVVAVAKDGKSFTARLFQGGEVVTINIDANSYVTAIPHIDSLQRGTVEGLPATHPDGPDVVRYVRYHGKEKAVVVRRKVGGTLGDTVDWQGLGALQPGQRFTMRSVEYGTRGNETSKDHGRIVAREIAVPGEKPGEYHFEDANWYPSQLNVMGQRWLDIFFKGKTTITADDFQRDYQTLISNEGVKSPTDNLQQGATLGRLLYGLTASYEATGDVRFLQAAKAGIEYQKREMRNTNSDGLWLYGVRHPKEGTLDRKQSLAAADNTSGDDTGAIALYHQVYTIAGMAAYYRATLDKSVLETIESTINAIDKYYRDPVNGGYYSHIDPVNFSPHDPSLGDRKDQKNWNSVGDIIPAVLINLMNGLGPKSETDGLNPLREKAENILKETTGLIIDKFPDPLSDFVQERFTDPGTTKGAPWTPVNDFRWQGGPDKKGRGVVGHNFKIGWQLLRTMPHYEQLAAEARKNGDMAAAAEYTKHAEDSKKVALDRIDSMLEHGIGPAGNVFDTFNRTIGDDGKYTFAWDPTTDFWQLEQAILALQLAHKATVGPDGGETKYLAAERRVQAFFNRFFFQADGKVHFRTQRDGRPILDDDSYSAEGNESKSFYHMSENALLSYTYNMYVRGEPIALHKHLAANREQEVVPLNPDFLGEGFTYKIKIGNEEMTPAKPGDPSFTLPAKFKGKDVDMVVTIVPAKKAAPTSTRSP